MNEKLELLSIVITLRPETAGRLSDNQARAAHAWWLNRARSGAPDLAAQWHRANQPRPFTLSGLWAGREPAWGPLTLSPERTVALRLTTLDRPTADLAQKLLLDHHPSFLRLGKVEFQVEEVTVNPRRHPWAGRGSYDELVSQRLMQGAQLPGRLDFTFRPFTDFQRSPPPNDPLGAGKYALPFPLPELVMQSLLRRWNAFAPAQAPAELPAFCAHRLLVSSHQIEARLLKFPGRRPTSGFHGRVRYSLYQCDPYWTGLIHLLAAYAFYAGVGGRTATGLGQCRAIGG